MIGLGQMQLSSVLTCKQPKQTVAMTPSKVVNHNHKNCETKARIKSNNQPTLKDRQGTIQW